MTDDDIRRCAKESWHVPPVEIYAFARRILILAEAQRGAEPIADGEYFRSPAPGQSDFIIWRPEFTPRHGMKLYATPQRTAQGQDRDTAMPRSGSSADDQPAPAAVTTICGAVSPIGLLCKFKPYHSSPHSWDTCYAPAAATPRTYDKFADDQLIHRDRVVLSPVIVERLERENAELQQQCAALTLDAREMLKQLTELREQLTAERKARKEERQKAFHAILEYKNAAESAEARVRELENKHG